MAFLINVHSIGMFAFIYYNNDRGSDKGFIVKNDVIYGVDNSYQLWSYSLKNRVLNILGKLPDNIDYLTDFDGTQFLFSVRTTAKKEITEVTFDH